MGDLEPNCPRKLRTGIDEEAQYAMSKAWWKIDKQVLQNPYKSMPTQIAELIKQKRGELTINSECITPWVI